MIRVYGVSVGNASYARVTAGVVGALEKLGLLSGFVPVDAFDDWGEYEGALAPVSVTIAPQHQRIVQMAATLGDHADRRLLLPLNSSWAPRDMLLYAERAGGQPRSFCTAFIAPSAWSAAMLRNLTDAPISVWRHGIEPAFAPDAEQSSKMRESVHAGLRVLHLSSTQRERKGTVLLIHAWCQLRSRSLLGASKLRIALPGPPEEDGAIFRALREVRPVDRDSIEVILAPNLEPAKMASFLRSHHLVVQPSRGEGFGMVPLEALSCGVPVVATACAGHGEYLAPGVPGTSIIPHGEVAPIDDGPGAMAPSVRVADVADALLSAARSWDRLQSAALSAAASYQRLWSWEAVTREWAQQEGWIK